MKLSQLTRLMDKDDEIIINDDSKSVLSQRLYAGLVRGINRDNPINKYPITNIFGCDNAIVVFVVEPRKEGE